MKRTGGLLLALLMTTGLALGTAQAAKPKKVKTEAEVEWYRFVDLGIEIYGDVHSKKSKCEKGRNVTLVYNGPNGTPGTVIGTDKTDRKGDWEYVAEEGQPLPEGNYAAEVKRKRLHSGGREIVCKGTTSPNTALAD
jgi:hypothetical protein